MKQTTRFSELLFILLSKAVKRTQAFGGSRWELAKPSRLTETRRRDMGSSPSESSLDEPGQEAQWDPQPTCARWRP